MLTAIALQARIEANCIPEPNSGCWLWLRRCDRYGYGRISTPDGELKAHRASWTAFKGVIPPRLHVLHRCDIPLCVNPEHLWLGTHTDNMWDRVSKGRYSGSRETTGTTYRAKDNRWQAQFSGRYLGIFKTQAEASAAYWAARNGARS